MLSWPAPSVLYCTYDKLADKAAELNRTQQQHKQLSMG